MSTTWSIILTLVGGYIALVIVVFFIQAGLIYLPSVPTRDIVATPADIDLNYTTVNITTKDGIKLHGWLIPAEQQRGVILFFHGNAGNISHRLESIRLFNLLQLTTLIIDYRGYGQSEGKPSELGTYLDAQAAWQHLTEERHIPPDNIIIFGRSLGGAIATELATKTTPKALIVESTFASAAEIAADIYPYLPTKWLLRFNYNTSERLQSISVPKLIIHSTDDEIIPYKHAETLYANAKPTKQLLTIQGDHNSGFLSSATPYLKGVEQFLTDIGW